MPSPAPPDKLIDTSHEENYIFDRAKAYALLTKCARGSTSTTQFCQHSTPSPMRGSFVTFPFSPRPMHPSMPPQKTELQNRFIQFPQGCVHGACYVRAYNATRQLYTITTHSTSLHTSHNTHKVLPAGRAPQPPSSVGSLVPHKHCPSPCARRGRRGDSAQSLAIRVTLQPRREMWRYGKKGSSSTQ